MMNFRAFIVSIFVVIYLTSPQITVANYDTTPPELLNIEFDKNTVKAGEDIKVTIDVTDKGSGVKEIGWFVLKNPSKNNGVSTSDFHENVEGKWEGTITIPDGAEDGEWTLESLGISDNTGNYLQLTNFTNYSFKKSISVEGETEYDKTPPVLHNIVFDKNTVKAGEEIKVTIDVTDEGSGVKEIGWFVIKNPSKNNGASISDFQKNVEGKWEGTITIPEGAEDGEWTLESLGISDNTGNYLQLTNFTNYSFKKSISVEGETEYDKTPPVLHNIVFDKNTVKAGEEIKVTIDVTDEDSGVKEIGWFVIKNPSKNNGASTSDFQKNVEGKWEGTITIPEGAEGGEWTLERLGISDNTGNYLQLSSFNAYSFKKSITVIIPPDNEGPILEKIEVYPREVKVGEKVEIKATISDVGSGVKSGMVAYQNPSDNRYEFIDLTYDDQEGLWKGSYKVQPLDEGGEWSVDHISLRDIAGNSTGVYESLSSANFTIINEQGDGEGPVLETIEVFPKEVKVGEKLEIKATISDVGSGVKSAMVAYQNSSDNRYEFIDLTYDDQEGLWKGSYKVQPLDEGGEWSVDHISLRDIAGNSTGVYESLPSANFIIINEQGDGEGPVLETIEVFPKEVKVGEKVEIKAIISDVGSGVKSAMVAYQNPSDNRYEFIDLTYDDQEGLWKGSYKVQPLDERGLWIVDHISLSDNIGNQTGIYTSIQASFKVIDNIKNIQVKTAFNTSNVGLPINIVASSNDSKDLAYRFFVKDEQGRLINLQDYSEKDSVLWTPEKRGKYKIIVHAKNKDKLSSGYYFEARAETNYIVEEKVTSLNLTISNPDYLLKDKPVTFIANSKGSTDPVYRFYIRDENGALTTIQEYNSNNKVTWTPKEKGSYEVIVHAKDKNKISTGYYFEARVGESFDVKEEVYSVSFSEVKVEPQPLGSPINIVANAYGSNKPVYRFYVRDNEGHLTTLQEYSIDNTLKWIPEKKGNFIIIVHAKDYGKLSNGYYHEARAEIKYTIY
jgi:predicted RNA-binding protein with TRAM domain